MEIRSLGNSDFATIFRAFEQAFSDYEVQFSEVHVRAMLKRRGFDATLSFGMFDGDDIVAFTLNVVGHYNGIPTAYDTGTGTVKAFRGRGYAQAIFRHSIPYLKDAGIKQYLLEVLQHNTGANAVYDKLGFETVREFNYYNIPRSVVRVPEKVCSIPCRIERVGCEVIADLAGFCDFQPSWQNNIDSIRRASDDLICLCCYDGDTPVGYCVTEPASGDLTQLAVAPAFRRKGVGSLLFRKAFDSNEAEIVRVINTECRNEAVNAFLESMNIHPSGRQFEKICRL